MTKNEGERRSIKKKKRKLPSVNGTATPSEIFHRNLVDAVSNVEELDEHEQYVYPYSHHDQLSITSSKKHHYQGKRHHVPTIYRRATAPSPSSTGGASSLSLYYPQHQQHQQQYGQEHQINSTSRIGTGHNPPPRSCGGGTRGVLSDLLLNSHQHRSMSSFFKSSSTTPDRHLIDVNSVPHSSSPTPCQQHVSSYYTYGTNHQPLLHDEESDTWIKRGYHRPKLRSHVMDYPRNYTSIPQPWSHENSSSEDYDDDDDDQQQQQQPFYRRYHHDRYAEHLYSLHHSEQRKQNFYCVGSSCGRIFRNICISASVFILMLLVLALYMAEPLTGISASMGHILVSDKELIFDLVIKADNWNWWTIHSQQTDLSVFAFNELTTFDTTFGVDPAEYLGSCQHFDQPLSFKSSGTLGQHERANTSTQIRIKSPGADVGSNKRWSRMIRYSFGLVIRGVIKYRSFPLFSLSPHQSISLCVVTHVSPTTPTTSSFSYPHSYDDHDYCSHYPILPTMNK
ncbi:unnamed protein product [Absidia cylindrospora]